MIKFLAETLLSILSFGLFGIHALAANTADVVINEIAWMGSLPDQGETEQQAANDEWLELYNPTQNAISLDGWILKAKVGQLKIALKGTLAPGTYLVLSRANEKVAGVTADIVYPYRNNALINTGEDLQLLDAQGNLIDEAGATGGWFAGDNTTKQTMERKTQSAGSGLNQASWATSVNPGGTPGRQNTTSEPPRATPSPTSAQTPTPTPTPTQAPTPFPMLEPTPSQTPTPEPTSNPSIEPSPTPIPTPMEITANNPEENKIQMNQNLAPEPKSEKQNVETLKKIVKKYDQASSNKNSQSSLSTTTLKEITSKQTASIQESTSKTTSALPIFFIASLVALLSALFIFLLKKKFLKV